jgi:hypothetical protein
VFLRVSRILEATHPVNYLYRYFPQNPVMVTNIFPANHNHRFCLPITWYQASFNVPTSQTVGKPRGTLVRTLKYVTRLPTSKLYSFERAAWFRVWLATESARQPATFTEAVFVNYPISCLEPGSCCKAKQSLYRHGEVLKAPGVWGSQAFQKTGKWMRQGCEPYAPAALSSGDTPRTRFS